MRQKQVGVSLKYRARLASRSGSYVVLDKSDDAVLQENGEWLVKTFDGLKCPLAPLVTVPFAESLFLFLHDPSQHKACFSDTWVGVHEGVFFSDVRFEVGHQRRGAVHVHAVYILFVDLAGPPAQKMQDQGKPWRISLQLGPGAK